MASSLSHMHPHSPEGAVSGGVDRLFHLTLLLHCSQSGAVTLYVWRGLMGNPAAHADSLQDAPQLKLGALPRGILKLKSHGK